MKRYFDSFKVMVLAATFGALISILGIANVEASPAQTNLQVQQVQLSSTKAHKKPMTPEEKRALWKHIQSVEKTIKVLESDKPGIAYSFVEIDREKFLKVESKTAIKYIEMNSLIRWIFLKKDLK